jgi:23S rRNA pseudouridine1911/1915/1917 synthase
VVHRLDKDTSGVMLFARTLEAKKHLAQQFRVHSIGRRYVALVHGTFVGKRTLRSHLVEDRGDGLRGSARPGRREGQLAVTHVRAVTPLAGATLVSCELETGRTHQIRIHLAEAGYPIVGEAVYIRGYGGPRLDAPRTMLHAAELTFEHPVSGEELSFGVEPPEDFPAGDAAARLSHGRVSHAPTRASASRLRATWQLPRNLTYSERWTRSTR